MGSSLPFLNLASAKFSTKSDEVRSAREAHWCAKTPFGYAILRHQNVGQLLRHKSLRQGSYAWPDKMKLEGSFAKFWSRSIISTEGQTHKQLRQLAMPALSADYIETLKPQFSEAANVLAKEIAGRGECEFMLEFSEVFAGQAICILLGLPLNDWNIIASDASDLGLAMGVNCKTYEPQFNAACDRLMALSEKLIQRVRDGEDTTSYVARLIAQYDALEMNNHKALLDMIVISIFGGVDTTRSQLGIAMALFIAHPDQWQILRENPELAPQAVEEIIRAWPTTTWATREAVEDFEYEDILIEKGNTLHMLVHASARDPLICEDASFDITAKRKMHFGFGGGAHHCLGALVARTDIACALVALSRHINTIEYNGEAEWLPDSGNTSALSLPLRFTKPAP